MIQKTYQNSDFKSLTNSNPDEKLSPAGKADTWFIQYEKSINNRENQL